MYPMTPEPDIDDGGLWLLSMQSRGGVFAIPWEPRKAQKKPVAGLTRVTANPDNPIKLGALPDAPRQLAASQAVPVKTECIHPQVHVPQAFKPQGPMTSVTFVGGFRIVVCE